MRKTHPVVIEKVFGVGIDSIELCRIKLALKRWGKKFVCRLLTQTEIADWELRGASVSYLAGRWAAKEAVAKALGCGIGSKLSWQEVQIISNGNGQPTPQLCGKAREYFSRCKVRKILLSICHTRSVATASAIVVYEEIIDAAFINESVAVC